MKPQRLLVQTQLSNIVNAKFDLACDSGWQMTINRCREMLSLNPELRIDIMGPYVDYDGQRQVVDDPHGMHPDLFSTGRLRYVEHWIEPNALVTRYDFDWKNIEHQLNLEVHRRDERLRYDAVYLNDPMHLRAFKALFHVVGGYQPKFFVHSHFVDLPTVPKFPAEASLWLGQCEAAIRADHNFWQCVTAMHQFFDEMHRWFTPQVVDEVRLKSTPSDDGYSIAEITAPIAGEKLRFSMDELQKKVDGKVVLFFPNRISQGSNDYTRGWWFVHEFLPKLRASHPVDDYVVICGNPNMKLSNDELVKLCGSNGYLKLHDHTLNRDEYKTVGRLSHVAVALYDQKSDAYGGTAARELIELGCMPLWPDANEYSVMAREVKYPYLGKPDMSDLTSVTNIVMEHCRTFGRDGPWVQQLRRVVQQRCSYEATVPAMMRKMGLLDDVKAGE